MASGCEARRIGRALPRRARFARGPRPARGPHLARFARPLLCVVISAGLALLLASTLTADEHNAHANSNDREYRSGDWVPLEEALPRWPNRDQELRILERQARRPHTAEKRRVIARFTELVDTDSISPFDRASIDLLGYLALEGVRTQRMPAPRSNPAGSPLIRREAVELLGRIGGPHADEVVRSVMRSDDDLVVLAEAVYALGQIRSEPDSELLQLLTRILVRNNRIMHDDNLAYATLLTVERLHRSSWGIEDPDLFRAVFEVRNGPYLGVVRSKADEVARLLRRGR